MLGLTQKEWQRMRRMSALLIVIMAGAVALYGAFGKAEVLITPANIFAGVGLIVGGLLYMFHFRMVVVVSVTLVPISVALGSAVGLVITRLY